MPFWQPDSCKTLKRKDHQGQAPEQYTKAVALEKMAIQSDPSQLQPTPQTLCPWSRMWPFQRSALGAVQDRGAVDIPQVVRSAAEMRPMRRLPRVLRRGWARRCLLIVETDTRLLPFWQDMRRLYNNLLKIRGAVGLDLQLFEQGPFGPVRRPGKEEPALSSFKSPEPGTPILIISDLGLYGRADHATKSWLRFGKKLNRAGFFPVVLTPAPRRLWTDELAAVFRMACWDRGQRLPKLTGARSPGSRPLAMGKERKGTQLLLSLLAPAIRVEPELLRAMRLLLPAGQCDAGDEAAVWHHDCVRRGYTGFSFDPQHIADLRKAFVCDHPTELKQRACELISAHHRTLFRRGPHFFAEKQSQTESSDTASYSTGHYGFQKPEWADDFGVNQYGIYAEFHVRSAVQRMRWIMPGEFMMGSPQSEPERYDDEQQHEVILARGF